MFDKTGHEWGWCDLRAPQMPWHGLVTANLATQVWTILTDNGGITHTLADPGSSNLPPRMVWNFEKPGLPAVPTLSAAEDAAGMELRKDVLAPLAPSWQQGTHLHPLEDAGGNVWLVTGIAGTINTDRSGSFVLSLYPQDALEIGGEMAPLKTVTTTYAAGELPDGITATGTYTLRGIKDQGRKWLYTLSSSTLVGVNGILNGVIELTIAGTGSYSGGSVTGLSVSMSVLKTTAECAWQNTTVTDSIGGSEDPHPWLPGVACDVLACETGVVDEGNWTLTASTTETKKLRQERILLAAYAQDGTVKYPALEIVQDYTAENDSSYELVGTCVGEVGVGCISSSWTHTHICSRSTEYTVTAKLKLDGNYSDPVVYKEVQSASWTGEEDNAGTGSGSITYTVDGTDVGTYSDSRSHDAMEGCWMMAGTRGAEFLADPWPAWFQRDGSETLDNGSRTAHTETRTGATLGLMEPAANIASLVVGITGTQTDAWMPGCPVSGSTGIADGRIVAYASPKGLHAGGSLGPTTKGSFSCSAGPWGITLAYPRFAAYDPRDDRVALLQQHHCAYV